MNGDLYRAAVAAVVLVGALSGLAYLSLYRPSRWRSATARDASGWVLALTLFFLWSFFRTAWALWSGTGAPMMPWPYALSSLFLGVFLVGVVAYRLARFLYAVRQERLHPTTVCPRCAGVGVVAIEGGVRG